jgi:hypothetical protein
MLPISKILINPNHNLIRDWDRFLNVSIGLGLAQHFLYKKVVISGILLKLDFIRL